MFDIIKEVERLQLLQYTKVYGLPDKPKPKNPLVKHIDGDTLDNQAEQEGTAISHCFRSRTMDFGKRLIKAKGQYRRPACWA